MKTIAAQLSDKRVEELRIMFNKIGSRHRAKLMTARDAIISKEVSHFESGEDKPGDKEKYSTIFAD